MTGRRNAHVRLFVAVLALFAIVACFPGCAGGGGGTPSEVAGEFLDALIAHDAAGSFELLSEKFKGEWGITSMSWNGVMAKNPIPETAAYEITGEEVKGESAEVTIKPGQMSEQVVNLINENGDWRIDYELGEYYGLAPGS